MKEYEFKYPLIRVFFDVDQIACTFLEDIVKIYPQFKNQFEAKSWDIERLKPYKEVFIVLAIADIEEILERNIIVQDD